MKDLKSLIDKTESKFQGPEVKSKVGYPDEIGLWLSMENSCLSCSNSSFYQVGLKVSLKFPDKQK